MILKFCFQHNNYISVESEEDEPSLNSSHHSAIYKYNKKYFYNAGIAMLCLVLILVITIQFYSVYI